MKKILLLFITLWCAMVSIAQSFDVEKNAALQIVSANRTAIGLSADDLNNLMVTYSYVDKTIGVRYIYLQQTYQGIPVYNKTQSIAYKNNALASVMGTRIANIESKVNASMPSKTAESAVAVALAAKGFSPTSSITPISTKEMGRKVEFGNLGVSRENVTAQLMWFPSDNENSFKLGWFVYYTPTTKSDMWEIFVDASNGSVIGENNLTVSCNWDDPNHVHEFGEKHNQATMGSNPFDFSRVTRIENGTTSPSIVNAATYRVVPLPYEAPNFMPGAFPGTAPGNSTIVSNPWTNVPASFSNAVTKNWHTDASNTDYNYTRGNNVWAYHDRNNNNSGDPTRSATSTTALPSLTFSAYGNAPDYTADPITGGGTTGAMANNQAFNITNLFYYNNILHDVLYTHGFDEVARNFQSDNFGRGGNGGDHVLGEAQDGSGTNNANFGTPADGGSGRMQMYIWTQTSPSRDGDVDNGIIAHELGHGVSNRLMGSSTNQTGCVGNGEHAGEGISDYIALMTTQDWAVANVNSGLVGRGIGTFALGQPTTGVGIRSQRYSTDLAINNKFFDAVLPGAVHNRGEHWCAVAWEATWAIIQQSGTISPTIYYNSAGGGNAQAGNIAAMRIAMQAMKLVPCGTSFVEHRNAWLAADTLLYGGQFSCAIWRAFTKRQMGFFASSGSAASASDQIPDNTPKSQSDITTGVASIPAGQNMTYTVTASTCSGSAITGYEMRSTLPANVTFVSATNGGVFSAGVVRWPVSMAANGTFTAQVTITVNSNAFPGNVVTTNCLFESNLPAARTFGCKTVTTPITPILAGCPSVTTQPVNVTTCVGSSINFSVVANASNAITYQWQLLVGATWTNLTNVAPYSNVGTTTMTINPTAVGLNGNQYRCFMTTVDCTGGISSNPGVLTVVAASVGGTVNPASTNVCGVTNSTLLTLTGNVGNVVRWESSTVAAIGPFTAIANTTTTLTSTNIAATTWYRAIVQVSGGCLEAPSTVAVVNFQASAPMIIVADPNAPICAGDPTRLTASEGFGVQTFSNTTPITIVDVAPASVYPSVITISGFPATGITVQSVTLNGLNHTFAADIDMMLQSPSGQRVMLTSDAGGGSDFSNATIRYQDGAAAYPAGTVIPNGTYAPINTGSPDNFPAPGPGSITPATTLATFTGDFNGAWGLYIVDDLGGDVGSVTGGYSITFTGSVTTPITGGTFLWTPATGLNSTTTNPVGASPAVTTTYTVSHNNGVGCTRTASYTVVVNQRPLVATQPTDVTVCSGSPATFTITATGAGTLTYQWQVSTTGAAGPYTNIVAGAPYSGETTATLTINPTSALLNNNWYRCTVGGLCAPVAGSTSQPAKLSINALPTVAINPVGPVCGGVPGISGTQLSVASAAPPVPGSLTFTSGAINVAIPEGAFPTRPATAASNVIAVTGIPANATITSVAARINATHAYANDMVAVLKSPTGAVINLNAIGGYANNAGANYLNTTFSSAGTASIATGTAPFTGTWQADRAGVTFTAFNATLSGGPVGFDPTTTSWATYIGALAAGAANGNWTLAAYDAGAPDVGNLTRWDLIINYTTPGTLPGTQNWVYTWAPTTGLFTNSTATNPYTGGNTQTVYAAPSALTTYTVTARDTVTNCIGTSSVIVNYTPPAPAVTPNPVTMCLGDIPVLLKSSSSVTSVVNFTSGTIAVPIPDNTPTGGTSNITVSGIPANATITGIKTTVNGTHTWLGDVVMVLKAPGTLGTLNLDYYLNNTGGAAATTNFVNTAFSSASTTNIGTASPFTGTFRADGRLVPTAPVNGPAGPAGFLPTVPSYAALMSAMNANPGSVNGTYTFAAADYFNLDAGQLTRWDLEITYVVGVPATPAIWTPATGLFSNAAGTIPYVANTPVDSVWAQPTTIGINNYDVTVQSLSLPPTSIATTFANNNAFALAAFNFRNNNSFPVTITGIESIAGVGGASTATLYAKTSAISGPPGAINAGNGWNVVGTGTYTAVANTTTTVPQTFLSGLSFVIPANSTYGLAVESKQGATGNLRYSTLGAGVQTISNSGCDIITGTGIGYAGDIAPNAPTFTPRGFIGRVIFGTVSAPPCTSPARRVVVTVNQPVSITTQPVNTTICTDKVATFTAVAAGTTPDHNWQFSTFINNGTPGTWVTIANGGIYSGAKTATLTITNPPTSINGYLYRDSIKGAAPCGAVFSNIVRLNVNPLPTVVITGNPYLKLFPGLKATLTNTSSPIAASYVWRRNGAVVGGNTAQHVVDVDALGDYTLTVTDVNGCIGSSNTVTISDSSSGKVFIYPNPNSGVFQVRYYASLNTRAPRALNIYDAKGSRISVNQYPNNAPYQRMDVDLRKHGKGIYWVEVIDVNGERLAVGRAVVL